MNTRAVVVAAVALGAAGLAYLTDPRYGRRRRATVRGNALRVLNNGGAAAAAVARDAAHRAAGLATGAWQRAAPRSVDDETLAERVRAAIGRAVSYPGAIAVMAHNGSVALAGAVLKDEVDRVVRAVGRVAGVRHVEPRLDVHDRADGVPALQGPALPLSAAERRRRWTPGTSLLIAAAGGAIAVYGMARGGWFGRALAAVGGGAALAGASNHGIGEPAGSETARGVGQQKADPA